MYVATLSFHSREDRMFDLEERSGGVLLHLTSLPGPHGNGDLGAEAHRFAGQLAAAGQRWWQMLPVGPPGEGNSPYSARSAFAGSPLLIDLAALARDGVLRELAVPPRFPAERVDHAAAAAFRERELRRAFAAFERGRKRASYRAFRERAAAWLEAFALFSALRSASGGAPWRVRAGRGARSDGGRRRSSRLLQHHGPAVGESALPVVQAEAASLPLVDRPVRARARTVRCPAPGSLHRILARLAGPRRCSDRGERALGRRSP